MNFQVTGNNVTVTDSIKNILMKKFEKIQRHFDRITSIKVTFNKEHISQIAEATIHVPGHDFHAKESSEDLYKSIDLLVKNLDRQIIDHKEKLKDDSRGK